jgi:NADPH-dependent curcumin reductase CurA
VAAQLAKIKGARVVGIAGGQEKCALLTGELAFDAAVDYKAPDWRAHLKSATPEGIDVDCENVGRRSSGAQGPRALDHLGRAREIVPRLARWMA